MKKHFLGAMLLCLPVLAIAQSESGYGKTTWGMTPSQVVAAQGERARLIKPEKYKGSWGKVSINPVNIGASDYKVVFLFDDNDHLIQTNVSSLEQKNAGIIEDQFQNLRKLLTQKYGQPQFDGETVTWKTAVTTIELSKMVITGIVAQVSIRYLPNQRVQGDTQDL
ncbi:hypothetical protein [Rahnella sp. Larv3_ips]|uniref:hypothetical protein n=1 Tax=Rahnella TaxID=34037 RepID=UPI000EFB3B00|nr:hypothetical protein [Rahnella sp. Larv3_ips]